MCLKGLEISLQEGMHIKIEKEIYINLRPEARCFLVIMKFYFKQQIPKLRVYLQLTKHIHKTRSYCYHVPIHNNVNLLNQCTYYHVISKSFTGIGISAIRVTGIKMS